MPLRKEATILRPAIGRISGVCLLLVTISSIAFAADTVPSSEPGRSLDRLATSRRAGNILTDNRGAPDVRGVELHASVDIAVDATDNLFQGNGVADNEDIIGVLSPGISLAGGDDHVSAAVSYTADFTTLAVNEDQSSIDHDASCRFDALLSDRVAFWLSDRWQKETATAGSPESTPLEYSWNTVDAVVAMQPMAPGWVIELGYENYKRVIPDVAALDCRQNELAFRVDRLFKSTGQLFATLTAGEIAYFRMINRDVLYVEVPVELSGSLRSGGHVSMSIGAHWRQLDGGSGVVRPVGDLLLQRLFNSRMTLVGVGLSRQVLETVSYTSTTLDRQLASIEVAQSVTGGVRVRLRSYVEQDKEERAFALVSDSEEIRDDLLVGVQVGVDYQLTDLVGVRGEFTRENRDSNIDYFDYTENRVSIGVRIAL